MDRHIYKGGRLSIEYVSLLRRTLALLVETGLFVLCASHLPAITSAVQQDFLQLIESVIPRKIRKAGCHMYSRR